VNANNEDAGYGAEHSCADEPAAIKEEKPKQANCCFLTSITSKLKSCFSKEFNFGKLQRIGSYSVLHEAHHI
jgi:hypothetical protein